MVMRGNVLILDDFDHGDINRYGCNNDFVSTYELTISQEQAKKGHSSLKVDYHLGGWKTGNGAMYILFKEALFTEKRPIKFGIWVYGNGEVPWLRAVFIDGAGEYKTVNLTEKKMSWFGWKYLDANISFNWHLPLRLSQIYAVEVDKSYREDPGYSSTFYIDVLQFVYVNDIDLKGPYFSDIYPEKDYIYQDTFEFSARIADEITGVVAESISVKVNGEEIKHRYNEWTGIISYKFHGVTEDVYHITATAVDKAGNISVPGLNKEITVDLSPDVEKPIISNVTPIEKVVVYAEIPRISFHLIDLKSGVDQQDIEVALNGDSLDVTYDEASGWCYALPNRKLAPGDHFFTITAKDRAGNNINPVKKEFHIKRLPQPTSGESFNLTIIPDTHSSAYTRLAFGHALFSPADVVIHMGDFVDAATEHEFNAFQNDANLLDQQVLLPLAGNHESFLGNLDSYTKRFGSPTYHIEYGDLLIIVLNTAYEQSITASDATQFDYLKKVLQFNQKNNVLITTHVPTRDVFDTTHEMVRDDADKFEQILSLYKNENPHVNVTVLFGHLHVLQQWKNSGVDYIITGNGAEKGYVDHDYGNLLGYGMLCVSRKGMSYFYYPYLDTINMTVNDHYINCINIKKDETMEISVYGKISILNTTYTVDLTPLDLIEKKWTIYDEQVAWIDHAGTLRGIKKGKTFAEVKIGDQQAKVEVNIF